MIRNIISFLLVTCFLNLCAFAHPSKAQARIELTFSLPPSSVIEDHSFSVDVTLTGADTNAEYYIRGVLFVPDSTQYFGFTKNNAGEWNSNSGEWTKYYKIQGNGTTNITFKPDLHASQYRSEQQYSFKVGRYTSGGSLTWSEQSPASISFTSEQAPISPSPSPTVTLIQEETNVSNDSSPTPSPTPTLTTIPATTVTNSIYLSEIMACPSPGEQEWIELYNSSNTSTVNLDGWKMQDSSDHSISLSGEISPQSFSVFLLSTSILNNAGDEVILFNPQHTQLDSMSYLDCIGGTSLIKINDQWKYTTTVTKQYTNQLTDVQPSPTATPKIVPTSTPKPKEANITPLTEDASSNSSHTDNTFQYVQTISIFPQFEPIQEASRSSTTSTSYSKENSETIPPQKSTSPFSRKLPFFLGGTSYILCAAVLAQKWYTLLSA